MCKKFNMGKVLLNPKSFEDFQKLKYNDVSKWESLKAEKLVA